MEKNLIPLLILGTGGFMYVNAQNKKTVVPSNSSTVVTASDGGRGGLQVDSSRIAMVGITINSQPDYKTWTRSHWAAWYQSLLQNNSPEDTKTIVWNAWLNGENPFAYYVETEGAAPINKYPNADVFVFSLAAYRPAANVGAFNITANSLPVYDTWTAWWNNVDVWECSHWKVWFDVMEADWGLATAQQKFVSAWSYEDNWASASNARICSHDCTFIEDMTQRGIDVAFFGVRTVCNLVNIPYNIIEAGENISQGAADTTATAASVTPWLIYGGVAVLAYKAYQFAK
jgi:hypothetical protein